jgi:hypothetical protein
MSKKGIILISTALFFLIGFVLVRQFIYQPHRNIAEEKVFKELTSEQFIHAFDSDSTFSETFTNQTISIYAKEIELDFENKSGMIDNKISVRFDTIQNVSESILEKVYVKGRFVGYDDLLEEFQMDQCVIINKTK